MEQVRLGQWAWRKKGRMYREGAGDGVKAYVHLVNKVGGIADTHKRAAGVDVILPAV